MIQSALGRTGRGNAGVGRLPGSAGTAVEGAGVGEVDAVRERLRERAPAAGLSLESETTTEDAGVRLVFAGDGTAAMPDEPRIVVTVAGDGTVSAPGFNPDRVKRVLAARRTRRGFGSVEEFAAAASLAPHEFVRIRELVVCTPRRPDPPLPPARDR
ncbi:hypothetical protein K1W54_15875 [Micromonospora sp. CPCC 205371]|nr:hypothetical protein [Micromonospora sp. CPCC 205371]